MKPRWKLANSGTLACLAAALGAPAFAADPPVNTGAGTFVPSGSTYASPPAAPAGAPGAAGPRNIGTIPTPDTIPAPGAAQVTNPAQIFGQYQTPKGVRLEKMFLDRFKESVVRVAAKDMAGNELSRAMGVAVGPGGEFVATPLSLVLGNAQQWADQIELTHAAGNKYTAKIALIDEEKNIVLLAPEANPAPVPFAREIDERPQMSVFTISFRDAERGRIEPRIHRGMLAAASPATGLLSVSGNSIDDAQAGTAVINSAGQFVGMLLPGQRGVLASTVTKLVVKARKSTPMEPRLIGTILGRGVLVDPSLKGSAFPTISAAIEAIKKGEAPKADPSRYTPARNRTVAPREADKVVVKVMPGTYREGKTLTLPANISIAGSGPDKSTIIGHDPAKPVVLVQDANNVVLSGFRIVPAAMQDMKAPTVILSKARGVEFSGNVVEAKGGVGLWAHQSRNVLVAGNVFARGRERAVSCDRTTGFEMKANGFLGDWPMAVSIDKGCQGLIERNLFFENKTAVAISSLAGRLEIAQNTFVRSGVGVKMMGAITNFRLADNLFFEVPNAFYSNGEPNLKSFGRNAIWMSKLTARGRAISNLDLVRSEPRFTAPDIYDFRLVAGRGQLGAATTSGLDLGAFQTSDIMGAYTSPFLKALGTAVGRPKLEQEWNLPDAGAARTSAGNPVAE